MTGTLSISKFPKICRFCLLESTELELISETPSVEIFWKVAGVQDVQVKFSFCFYFIGKLCSFKQNKVSNLSLSHLTNFRTSVICLKKYAQTVLEYLNHSQCLLKTAWTTSLS